MMAKQQMMNTHSFFLKVTENLEERKEFSSMLNVTAFYDLMCGSFSKLLLLNSGFKFFLKEDINKAEWLMD